MILVLAIILFIIFLIYSIRPSKSEEYTLEGLKLSWKNKVGIDGVVTKWIVTLKDSSGSVIHSHENSDAGNLKDFTGVTMNIVDKKEFDEKIIGDNTLELYYNDIKPDTKLYTKTVTFTRDDFGMALDTSNLEEIDIPPPPPPPQPTYTKKDNTVLWSSKKLDLDSGYDGKGNGGTLAGKDWTRSRLRAYPDECKKKCDSFPKCKGFAYYKGKKWCYLKSSNDLSKTSRYSKFDFYYKS